MQKTGTAVGQSAYTRIEVFQYPAGGAVPESASWELWKVAAVGLEEQPARASEADEARAAVEAAARAEGERRVAEEARKAFEAGRERGRQEGRQAEQEAQAAAMKAAQELRMRQAAELLAGFAAERDRYMHAVEHEVVELALAVAARILRREAQMDPLLLTGAVRVALGQLSGTTAARLFVPPEELALWTETVAAIPNLALKPAVQAGEGMRLGDCRIETELGSVDLGIRGQLAEIERGFFDRAGGSRRESAPPGETGRNPGLGGRA